MFLKSDGVGTKTGELQQNEKRVSMSSKTFTS